MYIYDYIIIGGGISGLYLTYKLMNSGKDILLLESSGRLGGRISTNDKKNFQVERGAARFSENHHTLLKLLKELGLEEEKYELSKDFTYVLNDKKVSFDGKKQLEDIVKKSKKYNKKCLQNITLFQLCVDIYDDNKAQKLQSLFGYDSEFVKMNAHSAIEMFKEDLLADDQYYVLKCGFYSVITKLEEVAKHAGKTYIFCSLQHPSLIKVHEELGYIKDPTPSSELAKNI